MENELAGELDPLPVTDEATDDIGLTNQHAPGWWQASDGNWYPPQPAPPAGPQTHSLPKCLACGAVTNWKVEHLLLVRHIVLSVLFLIPFVVPGFIYFFAVLLVRSGKTRRVKICPRCGGRNLWTFLY